MTTPGGPPHQQPGWQGNPIQQGDPSQQSNQTQQLPVQLFGPHTDAPTGQQRAAQAPPQSQPQQSQPQQSQPQQSQPQQGQEPQGASGGWGPPQHHQPTQFQPTQQAEAGQQAPQAQGAQGYGAPQQQPPRQGITPYQYGPPSQQYASAQQPAPQQARQGGGSASSAIWLLGIASVLAVVLGLSIDEDGKNAWSSVHAWGGLAIVGAVLTLAPVVMSAASRQRAWQVSACGAGALILYWVLFVLPGVGSNTSLATTVGVAAGVVAAWIASGRDTPGRDSSTTGGRNEHTW